MLLPVAAVAAAGLVTFRQSISALEEFRQETVEESKRIEEVSDLLVQADDLGEASVEEDDPATGERFVALSALIDQRFDDLQHLATQQERELAAEAEKIWDKSEADIQAAKAVPSGRATDDRLDPFHDHIDEAASILADLHSLNGNQVADEIASLRRREQDQLLAGLAALVIGSTVQDASIIEDVDSAMRETGLDPGSLILELTGTAVVENLNTASETLQTLRWMSVQLATRR